MDDSVIYGRISKLAVMRNLLLKVKTRCGKIKLKSNYIWHS